MADVGFFLLSVVGRVPPPPIRKNEDAPLKGQGVESTYVFPPPPGRRTLPFFFFLTKNILSPSFPFSKDGRDTIRSVLQ